MAERDSLGSGMNDGKQGISFDRILMRIKDVLWIVGLIWGFVYGSYKVAREIEKFIEQQNRTRDQMDIIQRQLSEVQQLITVGKVRRR